MNDPSVGGAKYFVRFIKKASEYVRACRMKTNGEAAQLLKRHMRWFEHQKDCRVRKIVFDGAKEYVNVTNALKADVSKFPLPQPTPLRRKNVRSK